ncbi:glycerophosphodiester phosphodiesterase [Hymenobacter sp. BT18]|uniref:glycerophosphodiester phosphodiesterase family protein n=1 Tax=Hymenobacter sp. BT18 TaxID=2835648 RepID=UPI00143E329E|nr:glycerophosphodiester phosphodiesterase family protein [Hymenobacter sp. BT18]QIX61534.1 glycerophosphodiester phosphodiesterase [Hymenobacter sp. BT18]
MLNSSVFPVIHGHRGCRGLYPENTLPAFRHAVTLGVEVLELDVVISADSQVVVSHEPWMSSAICRTPAGQPIAPDEQLQHNLYALSYPEIRRYDCGSTRHPAFPAQQSVPAYKPLLREVIQDVDRLSLALGRPLVRFSVELKSEPAGEGHFQPPPRQFLDLVVRELQALQVLARTTLLCFDKRILQLAHQLLPGMAVCLLVEDKQPHADHLQELGFVPTVYGPNFPLVSSELVTDLNELGIQLVPWTVNEYPDFHRLLAFHPAGITTDYPDRFLLASH